MDRRKAPARGQVLVTRPVEPPANIVRLVRLGKGARVLSDETIAVIEPALIEPE